MHVCGKYTLTLNKVSRVCAKQKILAPGDLFSREQKRQKRQKTAWRLNKLIQLQLGVTRNHVSIETALQARSENFIVGDQQMDVQLGQPALQAIQQLKE